VTSRRARVSPALRRVPAALVPAAARLPDRLSDDEDALNARAVETFVKAVGGRAQLTDVLTVAGADSSLDKVTTLLLDPRYSDMSLKRLCRLAGLTVADLFAAYKRALITRVHLEATYRIASKLLPVVDDVMTRAAPQPLLCPSCQGAGVAAPAGSPCPTCQSTGRVQTEPDLDRQKLALELGQLVERKGGLIVQQNNNQVAASLGGTAPGSLEQLQQAVGEILFGDRRRDDVHEAEVGEVDEVEVDETSEVEVGPPREEELWLPFGDPSDLPPSRWPGDPGEPEE
jgi:hypothetical protein